MTSGVQVLGTLQGTCATTLTGHTNNVYSVCQLADGRIVSGSEDKSIKVWDLSSNGGVGSCVLTLTGHTGYVYSVCQLADGRIVSGSDDKSIKVWS